ncbi:MAG: DsrE family protein [Bacillota bacterium]|nr:DsrE family protein [Bacillota bacterium]
MNYLIIINDGPYGNERAYNALRLAMSLQTVSEEISLNVSMIGDGVVNAINGQNTPNGYYNIGRMLKSVLIKKGKVKL